MADGDHGGSDKKGKSSALKRRASLLDPSIVAEAQFMVRGHSRADFEVIPKTKVTAFSDLLRPEDAIDLECLQLLREDFDKEGGSLNFGPFKAALGRVIGVGDDPELFHLKADTLFKKMDASNSGDVDWDGFCSYMMKDLEEKHQMMHEREIPLLVAPQNFVTPHRGLITRVIFKDNPPRFMSASENGVIVTWSMKMGVQRTYAVDIATSKHTRMTDFAPIPSAYRVAVCTTNRDIRMYDSGTSALVYTVLGLPNMVSSMRYYKDETVQDRGYLFFGDTSGGVNVLTFNTLATRLFPEKENPGEDSSNVNLSVLCTDTSRTDVACTYIRHQVHNCTGGEVDNGVRDICFLPHLNSFLSCAATSRGSMVLHPIDRAAKDGGSRFDVPRGVMTFAYSDEWNTIASGGNDYVLRLWNPYVCTHPAATLSGHLSSIMAVAINDSHGQVVSIDATEVCRIWDIQEQLCLNTITGFIPRGPSHKPPKIASVEWHEPTQSIIIASKDELAVVELSREPAVQATQTTHEQPVSCLHLVPEQGTLLTAATDGTICSWKIATGEPLMRFGAAHGMAAVTALTSGHGGRRFVSGASDGTAYVWNIHSGQILQELIKDSTKEVTGLTYGINQIFSVGWDGRVSSYSDEGTIKLSHGTTRVNMTRASDAQHNDDILAMDFCAPTFMVTGSYDGAVRYWNVQTLDTKACFSSREWTKQHNKFGELETAEMAQCYTLPDEKITSRPAVDDVLWLRYRVATLGETPAAQLVTSSDSGIVYFWNARVGRLLGSFRASHAAMGGETVTALATDSRNTMLLTGDSQGYVRVWGDISKYALNLNTCQKPTEMREWRAHKGGTVSAVVLAEEQQVVVTGSSDASVRVWSIKGNYIGTFGNDSQWVLGAGGPAPPTIEPTESSLDPSTAEMEEAAATATATEAAASEEITKEATLSAETKADKEDGAGGGAGGAGEGGGGEGGGGAAAAAGEAEATSTATAIATDGVADLTLSEEKKTVGTEGGTSSAAAVGSSSSLSSSSPVGVRNNVLGKFYTRRASEKLKERAALRVATAPIDTSRVNIKGYSGCMPYTAVVTADMETIRPVREPSAVMRSRKHRAEWG